MEVLSPFLIEERKGRGGGQGHGYEFNDQVSKFANKISKLANRHLRHDVLDFLTGRSD